MRAEFAGACAGAAVGVALALSAGLLASVPLGPECAGDGVGAAFAAAIAGNVVATVLGGSALGGSGPRASGALIVAALLTALTAAPSLEPHAHGPARLLAMMAASLVLGGVLLEDSSRGHGRRARRVHAPPTPARRLSGLGVRERNSGRARTDGEDFDAPIKNR